MATDTARIKLELASGRGEITAPFHHTAQRKRNKTDPAAVPDERLASEQVIVAVPEARGSEPEGARVRPSIESRTWIAFIAALLAVAAALWWVMSQRLPDIDPREIVQRNLIDAQQALAEGRYTDPPERSALHYYSTVLALDPNNTRASAGIDAIADRYVTDARVLLGEQRIAEAGVAIEKARRVRPEHMGLVALDTMLRIELRKMLASSIAIHAKPVEELIKQVLPNPAADSSVARSRARNAAPTPAAPMTAVPEATAPGSAPKVAKQPPEKVNAAALSSLLADVKQTPTLAAANVPVPEPPAAGDNTSGRGANVEDSATVTAAATALPERAPPVVQSVEPRLIKMVEPEYPQEALMRGIEGWAEVSLNVTAAGDVVAPRIEDSSRSRLFNRAALSAVQQWKYAPRGDHATTETVRVRLQFRQSK